MLVIEEESPESSRFKRILKFRSHLFINNSPVVAGIAAEKIITTRNDVSSALELFENLLMQLLIYLKQETLVVLY